MSKVQVGTQVEGVWGAMFPTSRGEVIAISGEKAKVQWIDDNELDVQVVDVTQIHPQGWTSVNGSPIGIFITEDDDSFSEESYRDYQNMVKKAQ